MTPGAILRDGARWGGALVLVLTVHVGGMAWVLWQAEAAAPPGEPAPIFIELAPADLPPAEEPQEQVTEAEPTPEPEAEPQPEPTPDPEPEPEPEPEPTPELAEPDLPPLPELEPLADVNELFPPVSDPELALAESSRPQRRPEPQPEPEPQRQVRREEPREPEPRRQEQPRGEQPRRQQQQAAAPSGMRGQTRAATGPSPQQRANAEASWRQQVGTCMVRAISRASGARGSRMVINVQIARNGRVQGVGMAQSTGDARVDSQIVRSAGRARCPAAPAALTDASYTFQQPIAIR